MIEKDPFNLPFDNITALADTIGDVLQCPVTIENANHQLIAYSSHHMTTDSARTATIISRRVPEQVVGSLWKNGVLRQLMESDKPVRVRGISDVGLGDRLAVSIRHHNDVLGYIWVLEEGQPLDHKGQALLQRAAQASKQLMLQLQMQKRREEESKQNFFWQLLTGHSQSIDAVRRKAEELSIQLPSVFQIIVFQSEVDIELNMYLQMQYLVSMEAGIQSVLQLRDERQVILLAAPQSRNPALSITDSFICPFIERMKERFDIGIQGACGLLYNDYTLVEQSYREALQLLSMKKKFPQALKQVADYRGLGYYRYLPLIQQQTRSPHDSGAIQRLRRYDRKHNSCLLETLHAFLELDSHVKDTADTLHIHTNTLTTG